MDEIIYKPIGVIRTPFKEPRGVPIQSKAASGIKGTVDILPEYAEGLEDIEGFSHIILIYHFHLISSFSLKVKPYLDDTLRGVFSTRAPARPNPIGISIVGLDGVEGTKLRIRNVDIVDGTPLLDIKPYVPEFDVWEVERIGWLEKKIHKLSEAKDDSRFT